MAEPRLRCPKCDGTEFVVEEISEYQTHTVDFTDGKEEWDLEEADGIVNLYSAKCANCETEVERELAEAFGLELASEVAQ